MARFTIPLSLALAAIGAYALLYCFEVSRRVIPGAIGTSVGDDVVVIGYSVTAIATVIGVWAFAGSLRGSNAARNVSILAVVLCASAFAFWTWLHLTGVLIPYSRTFEQ